MAVSFKPCTFHINLLHSLQVGLSHEQIVNANNYFHLGQQGKLKVNAVVPLQNSTWLIIFLCFFFTESQLLVTPQFMMEQQPESVREYYSISSLVLSRISGNDPTLKRVEVTNISSSLSLLSNSLKTNDSIIQLTVWDDYTSQLRSDSILELLNSLERKKNLRILQLWRCRSLSVECVKRLAITLQYDTNIKDLSLLKCKIVSRLGSGKNIPGISFGFLSTKFLIDAL